MTLLNRANLEIVQSASSDAFDRGLNGLRVEPDGSTVASNGRVVVAAGPADESRAHFPEDACEVTDVPNDGLVLPTEFVDKVLKSLPGKTKRSSIQYAALSRVKSPNRVGMTVVDERGNPTTHAAPPKPDPYPDWKASIQDVSGGPKSGQVRVCINRKDLLEVIKTMEAAAPNRGGAPSPLFMEIAEDGDGIILRCANVETGQRVVGALKAMDTKDKWLTRDGWEEEVFAKRRIRLRRPSNS